MICLYASPNVCAAGGLDTEMGLPSGGAGVERRFVVVYLEKSIEGSFYR
jgi:hypothetical protein